MKLLQQGMWYLEKLGHTFWKETLLLSVEYLIFFQALSTTTYLSPLGSI